MAVAQIPFRYLYTTSRFNIFYSFFFLLFELSLLIYMEPGYAGSSLLLIENVFYGKTGVFFL